MSYPPDPKNPYGGNPYGQQQPGYGYPGPGGPGGAPMPGQPAYGYPQFPAGGPGVAQRMQGQVVTARVLLFFAGSIWALLGVLMLIGGLVAQEALDELPGMSGGAAVGAALVAFVLLGGLGALHIVPASMFGKGGTGTRVTAIIGASLNAVIALFYVVVSLGMHEEGAAALLVISLLWAVTAILTVIFCSVRQAGEWFNRPRY